MLHVYAFPVSVIMVCRFLRHNRNVILNFQRVDIHFYIRLTPDSHTIRPAQAWLKRKSLIVVFRKRKKKLLDFCHLHINDKMPQVSVARLTSALPLYKLKSMIYDHDLEVTPTGRDGTALNFTQTSTNMQSINLIHIHIQKTGELKRKACTTKQEIADIL